MEKLIEEHPLDGVVNVVGQGVTDVTADVRRRISENEQLKHAVSRRRHLAASANHERPEPHELLRRAAGVINELMFIANRELIIDTELVTRLATALREGAAAQIYVEPDAAEPRMLARLAFPAMLRTFSQPLQRPAR